MNGGVPTTSFGTPKGVMAPKSMSFAFPISVQWMLCGVTSRWTSRLEWRMARDDATSRISVHAAATDSGAS